MATAEPVGIERHEIQARLATSLGTALSLVAAPAGWSPDLTMVGDALVIVVALGGWTAANPGQPVPRSRTRQSERPAPSA